MTSLNIRTNTIDNRLIVKLFIISLPGNKYFVNQPPKFTSKTCKE
jgi:hypothetical protein